MTTIGVKRKEQNLTQAEFAEKLQVSQQIVARWESGQTLPRTCRLVKIATVLGCTVDELLKEEKKNEKQKDLCKS